MQGGIVRIKPIFSFADSERCADCGRKPTGKYVGFEMKGSAPAEARAYRPRSLCRKCATEQAKLDFFAYEGI